MPIIDTVIPEITKQCIEPISEQIVHRLIHILGFDGIFKNNLFIMSDDLQPSNFDDTNHELRYYNNRCDVTIKPGYNPLETAFSAIRSRDLDSYMSAKRWQYGEYGIFSDRRAGVDIYEVMVPCSIALDFAIRVKSIELSDMINTSLFSRYLTGGSVYDYNDIQFSYAVPDSIIKLLFRIYDMQDDVKNAMTYPEYLTIGSNSAITKLVNRERLSGDGELVVQRSSTKVLGKLEYDGDKHDTEDINKVSNRYLIHFSYIYQFAKPALMRLSYPVMVSNQMIHGQYVGKPQNMSIGEGKQAYPDKSINEYFLKNNTNRIDLTRSYPEVRYPYFDDWQRSPRMYKEVNLSYQPLFIGLLAINVDPTTGDLSLSVDIKSEIFPMLPAAAATEIEKVVVELNLDSNAHQTYGHMFRRLGIFDIAVFCNDGIVPFTDLTLTDDLVLSVGGTLDISRLYRIVISQIRDISILDRLYVYYMLDNIKYYIDFLTVNMQYLIDKHFVRVLKDRLTNANISEIQRVPSPREYWSNLTPSPIIVNNYVIEVCRSR